jgi:hypothetical protein
VSVQLFFEEKTGGKEEERKTHKIFPLPSDIFKPTRPVHECPFPMARLTFLLSLRVFSSSATGALSEGEG